MPDLDDLLVAVGVVCLAVGMWLWWGLAAALMLVGVVLIALGVGIATRDDGQPGVDRSAGG